MNSVTTNGTTSNNTISGNNELTGMGNVTLTYDNNGNTLTDDQGHTLVYDAWNRLVQVKDASNAVIESYAYDALGHRITETPVSNVTNNLYYSSGWQVVEEDISNSGLQLHTQYVWSPVFVDALVLRDEHLDGAYNGTSFNVNDRVYVIQDANYNVTAIVGHTPALGDTNGDDAVTLTDLNTVLNNLGTTTSAGASVGDVNGDGNVTIADLNIVLNHLGTGGFNVSQRFVYDAYGKVQVMTAAWGSTSDAFAWQYMYQGGRYDAATGLYDFRNREYSPTMMRWTTRDPLGYVDGMNDYGFVGENPEVRTDPAGKFSVFMEGFGGSSDGHDPSALDYPQYSWVNAFFRPEQADSAVGLVEKIFHGQPCLQNHPIIILGHSLGGDHAYYVANSLLRDGYQVDFVATLDPVNPFSVFTPGTYVADRRIKLIWNWFQTVDWVEGYSVANADHEVMNARGLWGTGVLGGKTDILQHTEIPQDNVISQEIKAKADEITAAWRKKIS